ncbi:MAG: metallophosphoesterase, partial [Clostridia bacterium]|nr:metallophosphoesterase [Clostridia bacterium]
MKRFFCFALFSFLLFSLSACEIASCSGKDRGDEPITQTVVTDNNGESWIDFIIEFPAGKDIKILQFADLQIQSLEWPRNQTRYDQLRGAFFSNGVTDHNERVWKYCDEAVQKACPDLIVLTGDNVYGECDDEGVLWDMLCDKMDSYGVPWLCVFGNHDNESAKGVLWQISRLKQSKSCVFKRGDVTGNSNYSVAIKQGGVYKYMFYLLDTNGCREKPNNPGESLLPDNVDIEHITQLSGIFTDQINWFRSSASISKEVTGDVPSLMFYHIPPVEATFTTAQSGVVQGSYFDNGESFGIFKEAHGGFLNARFYSAAREIGCVGMFVGHQHKIATSAVIDGIRLTYGLKTGTYDYHDSQMLGATEITINESDNAFNVKYLFSGQ